MPSQYSITVLESTGHVLGVVSSACTTEDMVAITSTRIILLFPKLVHRGVSQSVHARPWNRIKRLAKEEVSCNSEWGFACGKACGAAWRKGRVSDGTGVLYWNSAKERETIWRGRVEGCEDLFRDDGPFGKDDFKWRLQRFCRNNACPNFVDL